MPTVPKTPETPVMRPSSPITASNKSPYSYGSTTTTVPQPSSSSTNDSTTSSNVYFQIPTSTTPPNDTEFSESRGLQPAASTSLTPATMTKNPRERGTSPTDVKDVEHLLKKSLLDPTRKLFNDIDLENGKHLYEPLQQKEESLKTTKMKELIKVVDDEVPPVRWIILVVIPVFMGYACLFSLQHKVKAKYGIADDGSLESRAFGAAVSFLYLGNLIFRFAHNFLFFCVTPRWRVIIAMLSMMISMSVLLGPVFLWDNTNLVWVYVAYMLGGVAIGSFEANLLSAIAPLGHQTKLWATMGIPIGVSTITIGGFIVMAIGVVPEYIYGVTIFGLSIGIFIFSFIIPYHHVDNNSDSFSAFIQNIREWRQWLPQIKSHSIVLAVNMCCVSLFSPGLMLYVYDNPSGVPLWKGLVVDTDAFFAVYNSFTFIGATIGRNLAYTDKKNRPVVYFLIFSALGATINTFAGMNNFAIISPIAAMCVFLANGSIYNYTCKFIDSELKKEHNLTACSFWLFVGDLGSTTGSNLIPTLKLLFTK